MDGENRSSAFSTWSLVGVVLTLTLAYTGSRVYELPKSGRPERTAEIKIADEDQIVPYGHLWNDPLSNEVQTALKDGHFLDRVRATCPTGPAELKVIFVLLNDKPHPEDVEERRRFRFGIQSALAQARYKPLDAESLHIGAAPWLTLKTCIPFEWAQSYREEDLAGREGVKKLLLIAYINERQFLNGTIPNLDAGSEQLTGSSNSGELSIEAWMGDNELRRLCGLRYKIAEAVPIPVKVDPFVRILGPTSSSRLRKFMSSADKKLESPMPLDLEYGAAILAFSPGASVPFATLCSNIEEDVAAGIVHSTDDTVCSFTMGGKPVQLNRLGSDAQLTEVIAKELVLRSALPSKKEGHAILLAEQDTEYGLGMVKAFKESIARELQEDGRSADTEALHHYLHVLWFARGLDGYSSSAPQKIAADPRGSKQPTAGLPDLAGRGLTGGTAHGNAQTDYFERLRGEIANLRERLWLQEEYISSVGLLGFDVYDKILILRALRSELPNVHFFTLDLDAELLTREHYRFTHNMIVASHHGLSPDLRSAPGGTTDASVADFSPMILPFRHAYQTASFLGAQNLLRDAPQPIESKPRAFEIGRYGAVPLEPRSVGESDTKSFLVGTRLSIWLLHLIAGIVIFYSSGVYYSLGNFIGLDKWLGLKGSARHAQRSFLERFANHWKLEDIGIALMLLIAGLLLLKVVLVADQAGRTADEEPMYWLSGVSAWPTVIFRAICIGAGLVLFFLHFSRVSWGFDKIQEDFRDLADGAPAKGKEGSRFPRVVRWILPWVYLSPQERKSHHVEVTLWRRYRSMSNIVHTSIRLLLPTGILFGFYLASITYENTYFNPIRGATSNVWAQFLGSVNALVICALVALAVDHARLCLSFARHLHMVNSTWEDTLKHARIVRGGTSAHERSLAQVLPELFDLEVVARASEVISRAIYFPCVLLVLSMLGRVSLFDNWNWPVPLVALICIAFFSCIGAQWQMNASCVRIRGRYLVKLEERWLSTSDKELKAAIEYTKDRIRNLDLGAFRSFVDTPLARAMLLPLGGLSGVSLLQQLSTFYW